VNRKPPDNLVAMGRTNAPFGVKGWIRIYPSTADADSLAGYGSWWLGRGEGWQEYRVEQAKVHGGALVAKLQGVEDREAAVALKGMDVAVPRDAFPQPSANEYYWADLLGMAVVNREAVGFGSVAGILETGANDVLVVQEEGEAGRERLIPFIADVVLEVDVASRIIRVDWGADY
jgi:16S rRNA processing protein RimM